MQELSDNISFQQGTDTSVLLILFTGFVNRSEKAPFDFLGTANSYPYSKVFVRDPTRRMCLYGIGGRLDTIEKLVDALRDVAKRQNAKHIITVGSSGGSFPAMLTAHLLNADYCHAFSPFPYANVERSVQRLDWQVIRAYWRTVAKLNLFSFRKRKYYDLRRVLTNTNHRTRYYLHVCSGFRFDFNRAMCLAGLPNVRLFSYPCDQHVVIRYLARRKCMDKLFDISLQEHMAGLDCLGEMKVIA
jgi:hypothetical protein